MKEVRELAKTLGTRMAALGEREWHDHAEDARQLVLERGLPEPPPYGAPAPDDWVKIPVGTSVKAVRPSKRPTREGAKAAVERAQDALPSGEILTEAAYRAYAHDHPEEPTLKEIRDHGTLVELQKELAGLVASQRPKRRRRKKPGPKKQADRRALEEDESILALLREHGSLSRAEIAAVLGWSDSRANRVLKRLRDAGTVRMLSEASQSKKQRYDLVRRTRTRRSTPLPKTAPLPINRRAETQARDAMVFELLQQEGELSVAEIAEALGWKRKATNYTLSRLVDAGRVDRTEAVLNSPHQRYRARRRRRRAA